MSQEPTEGTQSDDRQSVQSDEVHEQEKRSTGLDNVERSDVEEEGDRPAQP